MRLSGSLCALAVIVAATAGEARSQDAPDRREISLSADQLLDIANRARAAGDLVTARTAYRALIDDQMVEVRSEARFRLAMMLVQTSQLSEAAVLLREVLDEQPNAQRVRLELARVLDMMGDDAGARRALREAQAGGLPPDVARFVDRYSTALRAQKPLGASLDLAIAPDSNINRATRSPTLGTVIGDFILDEDAQERSGVGLALRGQSYARLPLGGAANLLGRVSGSADLYGDTDFYDIVAGVSVGPELRSGADRISFEAGVIWRWFGGRAYSRAATLAFNWFHPLGRTEQLRVTANASLVDNRQNPLLDGTAYSASAGYERALSSRAGIALTLSGERQDLRDAAYSTWAAQATVVGYHEVGPMTLVATLGLGRLEADEQLQLFPEKRSDRSYRASLGATFRNLRVDRFAPFLRVAAERNLSSVELYDYRKLRTEIGVTRSF